MSYGIKAYGREENVIFDGLESPWIVSQQECRQEIADIGPSEYEIFGMSPGQAASAIQGYIRKRRTTVVVTVTNKFRRGTITSAALLELSNPALGVVTVPAGLSDTFTGYVDAYHYDYQFEGDLVNFSLSIMWTYPWALIDALPGT